MSHDGLEVVKRLVDVVARTFYKDDYVVALDYLNRNEIARSDVLARYLHMKPKDMHKIYNELEKHKLVRMMTRTDDEMEVTLYQRRRMQRYYYIDYKQFVDVVKWRMHKLQENVRSKMDQEQENLGFDCPACGRHFSVMDAVPLFNPQSKLFECEYCGTGLVDHTSPELAQQSQREFSRIMDQFSTIIELLQRTESIVLPAPRPLSEVPVPELGGEPSGDRGKQGKELGVARDTGAVSGDTVIEFAPDLSAREAARIREAELEKKLRQNALPAWHIWSSVSGVQMVDDQKITSEARLKHRRYVERRNLRRCRWNRREKDRARAALRETEEQMRAAAGGGGLKETSADAVEERREAFYARYYSAVARRSGIELPHDPREDYQRLLDQLAKNEELEKAELERRRQEMEKLEKERKEAAAAAAATFGNDRNAANHAFRNHRNRYNPSYARYSKSNFRNIRRVTKRLFEFVGASAADPPPAEQAEPTDDANAENAVPDGEAPVTDNDDDDDDDNDDDDARPDPYLEGIYALAHAKRRKLGLDDEAALELPEGLSDTMLVLPPNVVLDVDVDVAGQPKPITSITRDDEARMSIDEYTAYWNAWHSRARPVL
ncbi:hypothetical protein GGF46_003698 [Coemansia sp. RSA 552]|nr:hypothetical protein GGF46_003698 [Coemansia sp. RSA 552]